MKSATTAALAAALLATAATVPAPAQARDPSTASEALSALSILPVASVTAVASVAATAGASVVAVPAVLLSGAAQWLLLSAQASAEGTVWILERAGDGARLVARFTARNRADLQRLSQLSAGQPVSVTPVPGGWLLGHGAEALAFVPRQAERGHFHHERLN